MNIKIDLNKTLSKYQHGAILVEFVFVIPIILVLILGGFEMARYIRVHQVANKISYEMANVLLRTCVNSIDLEQITPAANDQIYVNLQNLRTEICYNSVFEDYVKKQNIVLAFGNKMLSKPFSINFVMANSNPSNHQLNVDFCRGIASTASEEDPIAKADCNKSNRATKLTSASCYCDLEIGEGETPSPHPKDKRPLPTFDKIVGDNASIGVIKSSHVAIWTEVSIAYSPVIQRLLLPFIGFHAGGDSGVVNNVTATTVTY